MPADTSLVLAALIARLVNDAPLTALLPDGVWLDVAKQGSQQFTLVSLLDGAYEGVFGGRAVYSALYLVKAVTLGNRQLGWSAEAAKQAAARYDAILEEQPLVAAGWNGMSLFRETDVVAVEDDPTDPGIRWQHRGGHYRVEMSVVGM